MLEKGKRYLLTTYAEVHTSGVFEGISEQIPGRPIVMMSDVKFVAETGNILTAQLDCIYPEGQSHDADGIIGVMAHDIVQIIPQGKKKKKKK